MHGLQDCAGPELVLVERQAHVPFVIVCQDGTYEYTYSTCSVFRKGGQVVGREDQMSDNTKVENIVDV